MNFLWPQRVWEPTGEDERGNTLWSSRTATPEDNDRRRDIEREFRERALARQ